MSYRDRFKSAKAEMQSVEDEIASELMGLDEEIETEIVVKPKPKPKSEPELVETKSKKPKLTEERVREIVNEIISVTLNQSNSVTPIQTTQSTIENPEIILNTCYHVIKQLSKWERFKNGTPFAEEIQDLYNELHRILFS